MYKNRFIFQFGFSLIVGVVLAGCVAQGIKTSDGVAPTVLMDTFKNSKARLTCQTSCSGAWGSVRKKAHTLYQNELWSDLASEVGRVGFESNLTYFYLGRAAEGLGHQDAASTYYKLGLTRLYACAGLINNCNGLDVPSEINAGLSRVQSNFVLTQPAEKNLQVQATQTSQLIEKVKEPSSSVTTSMPNLVEVTYDEFTKTTTYTGSMQNDGLQLIATKSDLGDWSYFVTVSYLYFSSFRYYHQAFDSNGMEMKINVTRKATACGGRVCEIFEYVTMPVSRDYLAMHRKTGVRFKIFSKTDASSIVELSGSQINEFLAKVL